MIIAGAGAASAGHDCGRNPVPVLGVPVQSAALSGVDSLYSIVQMPRHSGSVPPSASWRCERRPARRADPAQHDTVLHQCLSAWRQAQTDEVLDNPDPRGVRHRNRRA
ncbi:AIR carboxylase family protein [Klebsiella pneumoniae]|nr:AIR carboxylase family protein [Klebsiella pneumoniae]